MKIKSANGRSCVFFTSHPHAAAATSLSSRYLRYLDTMLAGAAMGMTTEENPEEMILCMNSR